MDGRVEFTNILAGYLYASAAAPTPSNGSAQIGDVNVSGDWYASNLVAGVENTISDNENFGNGNDTLISTTTPSIVSEIAGVNISGLILGTPTSISSSDHFGFDAADILSFKANGAAVALSAAPDTVPVGETTDVDIHEV